MFTKELPNPSPISKRQRHSSELKSEVIAQARHPHVLMAYVASSHGFNANFLRKWIQDAGRSYLIKRQVRLPARAEPATGDYRLAFSPIAFADTPEADSQSIAIEVIIGDTTIKVKWPVRASAPCLIGLRELIKVSFRSIPSSHSLAF
jgi:transposase